MLPTEPGDDPGAIPPEGADGPPDESLEERCRAALIQIRTQAEAGAVEAVVAGIQAVQESLKDPALPPEIAAQISAELKAIDLLAAMKATDMALRRAVSHAQADRKIERNQDIGIARGLLSRAVGLGADAKFKRAAEMMIESAMLTGGVKQTGPTRARPVDDAPAVRQLAKSERREYKRYEAPLLNVAVAQKRLTTVDWSIGGMLINRATADEFPSGETVVIELGVVGVKGTLRVSVVAVRVEIRKGGIAVRFSEVTPELGAFLRRAIASRGAA